MGSVCQQCGKAIGGVERSYKKWCSDACKMRAYRGRLKAKRQAAHVGGEGCETIGLKP